MALLDKDLKARLAKIDQIREDLKKAEKSAAKDVMEVLKKLMKENPLLVGMRWCQYTPYFNDGDECIFSMCTPEFKFAEGVIPSEELDDDNENGIYNTEGWIDTDYIDDDFYDKIEDIINHKDIAAVKKTVNNAEKVFSKLQSMEEQMKDMFGDHMQITITASGVETEEYEHD